jgi:WD40 repeat protein
LAGRVRRPQKNFTATCNLQQYFSRYWLKGPIMNCNKRIPLLLGCSLLLTKITGLPAQPDAPPAENQTVVKTPESTSGISSETTRQANGITACSPDGKCFLFASHDGRLKYCRADDGAVLHTFFHCGPKSLAFSADSRLLACAGGHNGRSGKIKVWNLADGHQLCTLATELAVAPSLAISPDGLLLVCTAGKARINLWEIAEGTSRWSVSLNRGVSAVAFSADGKMVIARCADGTTKALALTDGSLLRIPLPGTGRSL